MADINHVDPDDTIKPLEEDNDPPFSKPSASNGDSTDSLHSDDDIDEQEAYDIGLAEANDVNDPSNDTVKSYDPEHDERREN